MSRESSSDLIFGLLAEDRELITWAWSRVEIVSAIERRARDGQIDRANRREVLEMLHTVANEWDEVVDSDGLRSRAVELLGRHPLRAADAGQLAAATWIRDQAGNPLPFVCLDRRLGLAAEREGFRVLPPPD